MVNALMEMDKSGNPQHVQNVQKVTPEATMMRQILHTQKAMEVEMKLNDLKHKYGDIDEVSVLSKANELKTDDLEFVYKALQYDTAIERQKTLEQQSAQNLKAEIDANKKAVSTIVGTNQSNVVKQTPTLTADEKRIASLMGISEGEYLKWKVK
jgi:phage I-like protein